MWPACYSCWFVWRNSISMCTHCNVISLEHDSIPWRAKSQRINPMPLLFTSYDNYLQSSKSFQVGLNWLGDMNFGCQKPNKYGQFMFNEAIKVDIENSKETSFNNTISSTLSLSTLCNLKIYLKPSTYTRNSVVKRRTRNHPSHQQIKPIHLMDMTLTLISSTVMSTMHSKKNRWCCLRLIASLFFGNSLITCFVIWWK